MFDFIRDASSGRLNSFLLSVFVVVSTIDHIRLSERPVFSAVLGIAIAVVLILRIVDGDPAQSERIGA